MLSIKGTFENGVARPSEAVEGREGQAVIITFVEEASQSLAPDEAAWSELEQVIIQHTLSAQVSEPDVQPEQQQ